VGGPGAFGHHSPDRVGRYPIVKEIGRGGMGIVYLAEDLNLHRPIALKVLADHLSRDPGAQFRFRGEARLLASVGHPAIATVHSLEEAEGLQWITMEYVPGQNLAELISAGALDLAGALDIARQIAGALEAAHARRVVHRDLKPRNVRVTPAGCVKVLDFGLAGLLVEPDAETVSLSSPDGAAGLVAGTPGYMSPQQLRGLAPDIRDDVWSFGCVLFELLAGRRAFPGETLAARISTTFDSVPAWTQLPAETPSRIRDLLKACLAADRELRPESFRDIRRLLEEEHAGQLLGIAVIDAHVPLPTRIDVPRHVSPLVGRAGLVARVLDLLHGDRLVTLVGPAGCGKTRVAQEAARASAEDHECGVSYIDVAELAGDESLHDVLAARVGLTASCPEDTATCLRDRNVMLLLDNCDPRLDECADCVERLVRDTDTVRLLCTGREKLGVPGETVCRVPPLGREAVELFLERAVHLVPDFDASEQDLRAIREICDRLDGLPLAIVMAVPLIMSVPVGEIARVAGDLRLFRSYRRHVSPRHRTLLAACDWSFQQLSESERALFLRLARCSNPWTLEDARACVAGTLEDWEILDLVSRLVEKSLVEPDWAESRRTGRAHYRMLEILRSYAGSCESGV